METAARHLVRPEDLNHHGTLYGGRIAEWMTEAAFIGAAKLLGHTDHTVIVSTKELSIKQPVKPGTVLELNFELKAAGTTSLTIQVEGRDMLHSEASYCQGTFIFVTLDENGNKKPHGISL